MKYKLFSEYDQNQIKLKNLTVNYVRQGEGPALLLLHGFPGFWWDWRYLIEPLSEHFDVAWVGRY